MTGAGYKSTLDPGWRNLAGHLVFLTCLVLFALSMPAAAWDPKAAEFLLIIGMIGVWRYSWAVLHWVRSIIYRKIVFPRWRRRADALAEAGMPSHVYLLVTSFRIDSDTTMRVYEAAIREAIDCGAPTTIVASIVEMGDQRLIKQLFEMCAPPPDVRLKFVRIAGTGKRDALAFGFRAIAADNPPDDAVAAVVDGDSILEEGLIRRCAPFFRMFPRAGALTTDEDCEVQGNWVFHHWYAMRFAQRQIQMSSVGLSRNVLTLTGRMSMFRASIITDPEFIRRVEIDWIDHWRLGRIKFLTGDDKSSWYHLLRDGWQMLYIPDVRVLTVEDAPSESFLQGSIVLMRRWFGNMLRTNTRAIALGPRRMGLFTWWSIIDQRISMWTCLTGVIVTALYGVTEGPVMIALYAFWILSTRYLLTLSFLASRSTVSPWWPLLLYYNQVVGSFVKIYMVYHLNQQKWTRQKTTLAAQSSGWRTRLSAASSPAMMAVASITFVMLLGLSIGVFELPNTGAIMTSLGL
ncbi:MAG: glycosyltransferase family 2 protein [Pseudomonadota bacterium]